MGSKYTSQTVTGYNSSPPADDGSAVGSNQVKWSIVKTKIGDPLNNFAGAINTALTTALDMSMSTSAVTYTTTAADHLKPVRITAAATVHLGDAATMGVGYQTAVVNAYSAAITVDLATAGNKLNTVVGGSISLQPGNAIIVAINQAGDGYDILGHSFFDDTTPAPKIAGATVNFNAEVSLSSAATVNIGAALSNNVLITGVVTITAFDNVAAGITRNVRFSGILTLTHNGTSLILPSSANITTAANDCAEFESLGSGNWICRSYQRNSAQSLLYKTETISPSAVASAAFSTVLAPGKIYNLTGAVNVSAGSIPGLQFNSDSGTNYSTTFIWSSETNVPANTTGSGGNWAVNNIQLGDGANASDTFSFNLVFQTQPGTNTKTLVNGTITRVDSTPTFVRGFELSGIYNGTALASLGIFVGSGTLTGVISLRNLS